MKQSIPKCTIGAVTTWSSGGTPNRTREDYWSGDIPWISASTLKGSEIRTSNQCLSSEAVATGSKMAPVGSTLLLVRGSALHNEIRAGMVVAPVAFNQDVKALTPKRGLAPKYLTHVIRGNEPALLKLVTSAGNTAGVLDTKVVQAFEIFFPGESEQLMLVAAFDDVENLITALERIIVKKHAIKQGLMQQLLTGKTRLPGFTDGWRRVQLGEVAKVSRGASPRPIASDRWFDDSSTVGWVRIADLGRSDGLILKSTTQRLSADGIARSRFLPAGTLIMSIAATVGVPIVTGIPACIHDGFVAIEQLQGVDQSYLLYTLKSLESELRSAGQTGSQANVNTEIVNGLKINLPSIAEQRSVAEALRSVDEEMNALLRRLAKAKSIKQGMMQELLTGRTRLKPAEAGV